MTEAQSKNLKVGDKVYWDADRADFGEIVDVGYHAVAIKWNNVAGAGCGEQGIGTVAHADMEKIHRL